MNRKEALSVQTLNKQKPEDNAEQTDYIKIKACWTANRR